MAGGRACVPAVVNKETSVKVSVGEEIISRDLDLFLPTVTDRYEARPQSPIAHPLAKPIHVPA